MQEPEQVDMRGFWSQHRYLLLILLSIVLALVLVGISMGLYYSSGAQQLDLSRPGYVSVADQVKDETKAFGAFQASGEITKESIDEFTKLFDEQSKHATDVDAFSGDPLDPVALDID